MKTWNERITHGLALGLGMALICGGGVTNLGTALPIMLVAILTPNQNPKYALILAGWIAAGWVISPLLDQGTNSARALLQGVTVGSVVALASYTTWHLSHLLYNYLNTQKIVSTRYLWLLQIIYLLAYMSITVMMSLL
ncbi:MAG: hypothetical protein H6922_04170 [Pseudomonadaceae bacterium]|nr:hypothetical protein [Pseudomonadaceae bacterium]